MKRKDGTTVIWSSLTGMYPDECPVFETEDGSHIEARPLCADTGYMTVDRYMIQSDGRDFVDMSLLYKYGGKVTPLTRAARRLMRWARS